MRSRVPGGSSSGAAVSVARGQAAMGLGTDTGGSTRVPAAFCGVVGYKPTQRRVTREGAFPLSETLDSIGPLANSVACCAAVDRLIADAPTPLHPPLPVRGLRLGVPTDYVLDDLDDAVSRAFERALSALSLAGAIIERLRMPDFTRMDGDLRARHHRQCGSLRLPLEGGFASPARGLRPQRARARRAGRAHDGRRLHRACARARGRDRQRRPADRAV